jgi:hypothetical protein
MSDWREQLKECKKKMFPDLKDKMVRFSNKQVKAKKYVKLHDTSKGPRLSWRKHTK